MVVILSRPPRLLRVGVALLRVGALALLRVGAALLRVGAALLRVGAAALSSRRCCSSDARPLSFLEQSLLLREPFVDLASSLSIAIVMTKNEVS